MPFPHPFEILKPGIGPSSSHTLGPLLAARDFRRLLENRDLPGERIEARLRGSLALTGKGHLTDAAVTAGLSGFDPEQEPRATIQSIHREVQREGRVRIGSRIFSFAPERDIVFDTSPAPLDHPNTFVLSVRAEDGTALLEETYLSIGGGRVLGGGFPPRRERNPNDQPPTLTLALRSCLAEGTDLAAFALKRAREEHGLEEYQVLARMELLWEMMAAAIDRGLTTEGVLPGSLMLERRAGDLFENYQKSIRKWGLLSRDLTLAAIYAMAVAEENAAGGRLVTAPTCGSAGILPATLQMLKDRFRLPTRRILESMLVAALVGGVVAENASISGAEVGCQGEVGVASAMAAAAVVHCLEGTPAQSEAAAEMALEHHLGLTCDPIAGLVQIPCIERNAVGAVTALNAANLALLSSGRHMISFDTVVATMKEVGCDMNRKYKETALGGLASLRKPEP